MTSVDLKRYFYREVFNSQVLPMGILSHLSFAPHLLCMLCDYTMDKYALSGLPSLLIFSKTVYPT